MAEAFGKIELSSGQVVALVGPTGSGKTRLMDDIEAVADADTVTGRTVLVDGEGVPLEKRAELSFSLVAHLGQRMAFALDTDVAGFLAMHARAEGRPVDVEAVVEAANRITQEPISPSVPLHRLSGGQSRALMISDIALLSDSPIVLIDEIENAGVDKDEALKALVREGKLCILATHDPLTALQAEVRIVMEDGAVKAVRTRTEAELESLSFLRESEERTKRIVGRMRSGEEMTW